MGEHSWARVIARGFSFSSSTPVTPSQDAPMPPPASATYQRLRDYIAERMRMSHVYQPLMLMELHGHGVAWQEAAQPRRRKWPAGSWGKT